MRSSRVFQQQIKETIGRDPSVDELAFLKNWHDTDFKRKLTGPLTSCDDVTSIIVVAHHFITKSSFTEIEIMESVRRMTNDILCTGNRLEGISLHCRFPKKNIKGTKQIIQRIRRFSKRDRIRSSFSFFSLDDRIELIVVAGAVQEKEFIVKAIKDGDVLLLFSSSLYEHELAKFLQDLSSTSGCQFVKRATSSNASIFIATISKIINKGVNINRILRIQDKATHFIALVNKESESTIKTLAREYKLSTSAIGIVSSDNILRLEGAEIALPISSLSMFDDEEFLPTSLRIPRELEDNIEVELKRIRQPKLFNDTLMKLMAREECLEASRHSLISDKTVIVVAEEDQITRLDPKRGAQAAFALAVRKIVSCGATPDLASVTVNLTQPLSYKDYYYFREFAEGIQSAALGLQLDVPSSKVFLHAEYGYPYLSVAASGHLEKGSKQLTSAFKDADDFILMLGSHRGELGCSVYTHLKFSKTRGPVPMVDLTIEKEIRQIILVANRLGLIKSAFYSSSGGLAVAIAHSIICSDKILGARIHLSSKIRNDELLFGETRGLAIISVAEESIIEIERLCMNSGVPCRAIGRVTNNGQYTFNNLIDFKREKLTRFHRESLKRIFG